jgi:hypothetical protein
VAKVEYYLFYDRRYLVKVVDHAEAFQFLDGKWNRADTFASKVSGMGGDADFDAVTQDEAKKLFPGAFV